MNPRFKGFGSFLIFVPVLLYIPLRALIGNWEEVHRSAVLSIHLAISGVLLFVIAAIQDKRAGIDVWSKHAWTSGLLESQHICFHVPLRLAAAVVFLGAIVVPFVT